MIPGGELIGSDELQQDGESDRAHRHQFDGYIGGVPEVIKTESEGRHAN